MRSDEYLTIQEDVRAEIKVKGSRFIGTAKPVETKDDAEVFIESMRKEFHNSTHNCFAYRIGIGENSIFRYSDDGEPSGTAGKPMFAVLEGIGLTNLCIVVTRYFGGTKLGTGGLIRAYTNCAKHVLEEAIQIKKIIRDIIRIKFAYDNTSPVMNYIDRFNGKIINQDYGNDVILTVAIRKNEISHFKNQLINAVRGNVRFI